MNTRATKGSTTRGNSRLVPFWAATTRGIIIIVPKSAMMAPRITS
jgi:hypothetical protein